MQDAGIMLAAFQFFRHMHDAGSSKVAAGIAQVSLTVMLTLTSLFLLVS